MDIKSHEVFERRRDGSNGNNNDNNNNNNNNYNGNTSVSCTDQTLDRPLSLGYVSPRTLAKSPLSSAAGSSLKAVRYRECLKNHAASVGGSVHDGCGEFMPSGEEGSIEALKCAACDCHRNFHRKEVEGGGGGDLGHRHHQYGSAGRRPPPGVMNMVLNPLQLPPPSFPPYHHHHHHPQKYGLSPPSGMVTPMSVAYGGGSGAGGGGGGGTESSSEDLNLYGQSSGEHGAVVQQPGPPQPPFSLSKKRFRTKFTSEQKERMMEFAEKVGWRMNKQDEEELERFCAEIGVKRQVFKVWMHNNKNNIKKQQPV